jgi:hypothetical protein
MRRRAPRRIADVSHPAALFAFEGDFQTDLRCIPMVVRHRLDECGIKLSLKDWVKLGPQFRATVLESAGKAKLQKFEDEVENLVGRRTGAPPARCDIDPSPAWANTKKIPDEVVAKAAAEGVAITPAQWAGLAPLQRFALFKLSRSSHKNENFVPACREFGIVAG